MPPFRSPHRKELGGPRRGRAVRYRRFVEEGVGREIDDPREAVRWQALLGSESFARRVRDRLRAGREERAPVRAPAVGREQLRPEEVLRSVAKRYQLPVERLQAKGSYGLEARNVALWLIWERCGLSQREIGELFGGMNGAAVAQGLRRLREECRSYTKQCKRDALSLWRASGRSAAKVGVD